MRVCAWISGGIFVERGGGGGGGGEDGVRCQHLKMVRAVHL